MQEIEVLERESFNAFAELMEDNLGMVLERHLEAAQGYLQNIANAFETHDFAQLARAAHPLKSSSQQIGALKVATIAMEIEKLAKEPPQDTQRLQVLVQQVHSAQAELSAALERHLKEKAA